MDIPLSQITIGQFAQVCGALIGASAFTFAMAYVFANLVLDVLDSARQLFGIFWDKLKKSSS